nr:hypothetical protein [Tanacetum cinerariifolium]
MRWQGKDLFGRVTPFFETMLIQHPANVGKDLGQPTKPQHTPTTALPSHVEPIPTFASSLYPKKTHKHRKSKRKAIEISQFSGPTTFVADETVHEERGDKVERAATTTSSLEAEQDSAERVLALENITTAKDLEITNLKKRVKSAPVATIGVFVSTTEPSTPPTATGFEDEDLIITQTLMKMRSDKSKEKSKEKSSETATRPTGRVIIKEASETTTRPTIPPQQQLDPKDIGVVEGSGKKVKKSGKEVVSKKRTRKGVDEESVKRQKLKDDAKKEEHKPFLEIVPNADKVINIKPLATKSTIVD